MKPISNKVIRELHLYKDETVSKLAYINGINSVPRLLLDLFCFAQTFFGHPPPLMKIPPPCTSETPLSVIIRTKFKIFSVILFVVVAIFYVFSYFGVVPILMTFPSFGR